VLVQQADDGLLLLGAGVGQGPAQRWDGGRGVEVVFPLAQGAFRQAESKRSFRAVVAQLGERRGEVDGAAAGTLFKGAPCFRAGPVCGVVHDGPHHAQVLLEEGVAR